MPYCRNCGNQLQEADNFCETCGAARRGAAPKVTYTGKTCPYCQFPLKVDSEVTICSSCGIPHHGECWQENGGCTTFGCRGLTSEQEILSNTMQTPSTPEAGQVADEMLVFSFDEGSARQVTGSARSIRTTGARKARQRKSGQSIYQFIYQTGELSLRDLPIGARAVDPSWAWEFCTVNNYIEGGQEELFIWIVVAKDHYKGLPPHVTLMSEELIGQHAFDNSKRWLGLIPGSNHWGKSGTGNASWGLRPWLNSTGIYREEGFYLFFSESFQEVLLKTTLPNKEWENGKVYKTKDYIFLPSTTELGDSSHDRTYRIGTCYPYFYKAVDAKRVASLGEEAWWYWTRSPDSDGGNYVRVVSDTGEFVGSERADIENGVRPVLNLKSETLVSEIRD